MDLYNPSTPILATYASLYEQSGFRFAASQSHYLFQKSGYLYNLSSTVNDSRMTLGVESSIRDPKVTVPAMLIMDEKDYVLKVFWHEGLHPKWDSETFCARIGHIYIYIP
ncbi:hypothetical protein VIGAN_07096200 [Vigna angularis var. angularis]|uniref:Uncharacterized protein n=1 Tax=Vigna angularis var. angularis TaxID=157739 RepID=A0A0S3SHC0_PHAAN|nr:hypothetical protein VIGAN_07096200 [Vigna angularis var. angularis]